MIKVLLCTVAGLFAPSGIVAQERPANDSSLVLGGAWVRALPPTQNNTAAYLTIDNQGETAVAVVGARADIAGTVEFHTTRELDGYLRMEQLEGLALPAGEQIELQPGGTHLMLLALKTMPEPGDTVDLCLVLASGEEICVQALARKTAPVAGDGQHQHH